MVLEKAKEVIGMGKDNDPEPPEGTSEHEQWLEKEPEQRGDWLKEREQWLEKEPDPPCLTLADFFKSAGEETGQ